MDDWREEEILSTVRAYPEPSTKYAETSCVAGVTSDNKPIRLFPIPVRHLPKERLFQKYSIINARIRKASSDARPESHNTDVDSIVLKRRIDTKDNWLERNKRVQCFRVADSLEELRERFDESGSSNSPSLALIRPKAIHKFTIVKRGSTDWSEAERASLERRSLFDTSSRPSLEYVPFRFRYTFQCNSDRCTGHTLSMLDWEVNEAYRNFKRIYKAREGPQGWEAKLRLKFESFVTETDLQFFLGTISTKPWQWTIVGIYYPKKTTDALPLF